MTAASAAVAAAAIIGAALRHWLHREVTGVVNDSVADVIRRQAEFERRQGRHLDRQDDEIAAIRRMVDRLWELAARGAGRPRPERRGGR